MLQEPDGSATAGNWGAPPTRAGELVKLNDYEMASRLSYLVLGQVAGQTICLPPQAAGQLQTSRARSPHRPSACWPPEKVAVGLERFVVPVAESLLGVPTHVQGRERSPTTTRAGRPDDDAEGDRRLLRGPSAGQYRSKFDNTVHTRPSLVRRRLPGQAVRRHSNVTGTELPPGRRSTRPSARACSPTAAYLAGHSDTAHGQPDPPRTATSWRRCCASHHLPPPTTSCRRCAERKPRPDHPAALSKSPRMTAARAASLPQAHQRRRLRLRELRRRRPAAATMDDGKPVDASGHARRCAVGRASTSSNARRAQQGDRHHERGARLHDQAVPALHAPAAGGRRRKRARSRAIAKAFARSAVRHARAAGRHHQDARVHSPSAPSQGEGQQ